MKILLAVDGSEYTRRMLDWLSVHEGSLFVKASYTFITVVPPVPPHVHRFIDRKTIEGSYADTAKEVLDPVVAFAGTHGWTFDTVTAIGHVSRTIVETLATGGYDLVVMGSQGHSALGTLVLGSVTQRLIADSPVPVLIVR